MNNKLLELAEKANIKWDDADACHISKLELEKFGEQIIAECINIANTKITGRGTAMQIEAAFYKDTNESRTGK
jgi:uncharacterized protein YaiI (UPF0178 family)